MTSVAGLEISVFEIDLSSAGQQLISQQCGYFHLWRFLNSSDGTISLEGEVRCTFGGQWSEERVPFGYNSRIQLAVPVDRVLVEWNAQPGRRAEILMTRDPNGLDAQNMPARQIVFQGQSRVVGLSSFAIPVTPSATQVQGNNPGRQRVLIQAPLGNPGPVIIGPSTGAGTLLSSGLVLEPGQTFVALASTAYFATSPISGNRLRVMSENA
jgi:hypothetical protein